MTDIRSGYPRQTWVLSTLPKDQPGLRETTYGTYLSFPVSAMSTSKVAGLGRDSLLYSGGSASYTSPWPALTGHPNLISEQCNTYPRLVPALFRFPTKDYGGAQRKPIDRAGDQTTLIPAGIYNTIFIYI